MLFDATTTQNLNNYDRRGMKHIELQGITNAVQTLSGITAGYDGEVITVSCRNQFALIHNSFSSTAGNRIHCHSNSNLLGTNVRATLRYNANKQEWEVLSFVRNTIAYARTSITVTGAPTTYSQLYAQQQTTQINNLVADTTQILAILKQHNLMP
jgi:hypothetical protein